jgi:acetyl/propionyl-CoA carboxylase alpha subunit
MGIKTTIPFHQELMNDARFVAGEFDTNFVEKGFTLVEGKLEEHLKIAAMATTLLAHQHKNGAKAKATRVHSRPHQGSSWKMSSRWRAL